ncbi:MAG: glycogen synthase, partial [Terracidiphilus sp.]
FKFKGMQAEGLWAAIERALAAFEDKEGWKRLMLNGMAQNYDWKQPAREYAAVYEEAALRRA